MKNKMFITLLSAALLYLLIPNLVFAGWVEKTVGSALAYLCELLFKPVFDTMVEALGGMLSTPDFKDLPFVEKAMRYSRYIAGSLLVTQFVFRIWKSKTSKLTTGNAEPYPDIIWRSLLSAVLIYGLPEILRYLLRINALLIEGIGQMGVDFTSGLKALVFPGSGATILVIFFCIFVVALIGLTLSNAIRLAELCFLYIIGPIIAVSHAGKGESFQIWVMQAVAVTFTQAVQFLMVGAAMNFTVNAEFNQWYSFLLPIGAIVVAVRGPQMLKQFLYSTGTAGAMTGGVKSIASTAIYTKMMKR
ncbi:hypothetical protein M5X06_00220 [Paenibacillus alvei]|uniref:Uncharacterized protein n=1 Tax=Paenibacillus alvei TaxID=44250 RepID=A0ABT4H3J9_PAEAL|nr:conjugal transfer protein TrbL family protein [Paenibacillus alvei]MCY9763553.1 hypothetical protein [Paenibacillus alvei]MCY9765260.1 hypothetical protein [Paenibacillus alvei]